MPRLKVDHLLRPLPPWRDEVLTECGLDPENLTVITREELRERLRDWGQQRSMMTTCITCYQTSRRWGRWESRPSEVIARDTERHGSLEMSMLDRELVAIAALIEAHREEFDALLAGLEQTADLATQRREKMLREARGATAPVRPLRPR